MWPPQVNRLRKHDALCWGLQHTFKGISKKIDGKIIILRGNLGIWPLKWICLRKMSPVLKISTHIYGISKKIDGKTFIFRVNLSMWSSNQSSQKNEALFWGFQHTFMGCSWEIDLLSKWKFSHLSPWNSHKCVLKPSEQGLFFWDDQFEVSHD